MKEFTDISLKLIGLNNEDRNILLKNINRVINQFAAPKNTICIFVVKTSGCLLSML